MAERKVMMTARLSKRHTIQLAIALTIFLVSGCAVAPQTMDQTATSAPAKFQELATTVAALDKSEDVSVTAWDELPAGELVRALLAGRNLTVSFHDDVDVHATISGVRSASLAQTLDVIAGRIGATWHPVIGGICFDSIDGKSTDSPVTIQYELTVCHQDVTGLDATQTTSLLRFATRPGASLEAVKVMQRGSTIELTLRGFLCDHACFAAAQNVRLQQARMATR